MKIQARAIYPRIQEESCSVEDKSSKNKKRVVSPYFQNNKKKKSRGEADGDVSSLQRIVSPYFQEKKKKSRADSDRQMSSRQRVVSPYFLNVSDEKPLVSVACSDPTACENDNVRKRKGKKGRGEAQENSTLIVESVYFDKVTGSWGSKNHKRNVKFPIGNSIQSNRAIFLHRKYRLTSSDECVDGIGEVKGTGVGVEENKHIVNSSGNCQFGDLDYLCSRLAYTGGYIRTTEMNEVAPQSQGNLSQVNGAEFKLLKAKRDKLINERRTEFVLNSCCKVLSGAGKEQEAAIVSSKKEETNVKGNTLKKIQARKVSPYFQSSTKFQKGEKIVCEETNSCANIIRCSMISGGSSNINGCNITDLCTKEIMKDDEMLEGNKKPSRVRKTPLKSPILSSSQKRDVAYARKGAENTWRPPRSDINLLQEEHWHDPWRVMVICMLLNRTQGTQTKRIISKLFSLCPDAKRATEVEPEQIEKIIQTLGLQKKRAAMIHRFSKEYLEDGWTHVTQLHGIGKYAADAYAIFCTGMWERVKPVDHKLTEYWNFLCESHNGTE